METPNGASWLIGIDACRVAARKRAKSWEPERGLQVTSEVGRKMFDMRESCCWGEGRCECESLVDLESGSSSACYGLRRHADGRLQTFSSCSSPSWRKLRSRSRSGSGSRPALYGGNAEKREGMFCSERDVRKVRRSLRLLGLELSDFGVYSEGAEKSPGRKGREHCPTFRTKVASRSVSLEWLRESVRRAWAEDELDESHRRLLARAAYEEWYFRKERELCDRREEERVRRAKAKGNLNEEMERKKERSEEEFEKWLQRKKRKRKEKDSAGKREEKPLRVLMKSREEIEEAFLKWKKGKDSELERRKKERKKEEEKKRGLERQKAEKKATAEKAFLQWKRKLEENEKAEEEEAKRKRRKERQELERRKKEEKENAISFQVWKEAKDQEMKEKIQHVRETERAAKEERLVQMEERMYEAEQAFENWLEKVDSRKQKQFCSIGTYQKPIPWIPV